MFVLFGFFMLIYKIKKLYPLQGITFLYNNRIAYSLFIHRLYVFYYIKYREAVD